jgi:hypothetical protein
MIELIDVLEARFRFSQCTSDPDGFCSSHVPELGVLACARRPSSPCLVPSAMSGFGGAGVVGAGSGNDGSSDDRPSGGGTSGGGASCGENADGRAPTTARAPSSACCQTVVRNTQAYP